MFIFANAVNPAINNDVDVDAKDNMFVNLNEAPNVIVGGVGVIFGIIVKLFTIYVYFKIMAIICCSQFVFTIGHKALGGVYYLGTMFWNSLTHGNEWVEIAFMVSSISVTIMFLKMIHDDNENMDSFITRLKADLADRDAVIAELTKKKREANSVTLVSTMVDSEWETITESSITEEDYLEEDYLEEDYLEEDYLEEGLEEDEDLEDDEDLEGDSDSDYDPDVDEY